MSTWPMYVHEISAFDSDFYQLDAKGCWQPAIAGDWVAVPTPPQNLRPEPSPADGISPFQRTHVILSGERPVGFACVGLAPFRYMPADADLILAEFFLIHASRGVGIGQAAARALVRRYPGRWSLGAIHDNARAIGFWRKTLPVLGLHDVRERATGRDVTWDFIAPP